MNSVLLIAIGVVIGWYADRLLFTLRTIAERLKPKTLPPESGVVDNDAVRLPIASRTISSAGAVIDPMTEEEYIASNNKAVRKLNGR